MGKSAPNVSGGVLSLSVAFLALKTRVASSARSLTRISSLLCRLVIPAFLKLEVTFLKLNANLNAFKIACKNLILLIVNSVY